jgi:hypothetical protein
MGKPRHPSIRISTSVRTTSRLDVLVFSSILFSVAFFIVLLFVNFGTAKKTFASSGIHGAKTISTTGVILNEFTILKENISAGATTILVESSMLNQNNRFEEKLSAGDLVMIVQMKGATMNFPGNESNSETAVASFHNAGKFEFNEVASVPDSITINLVSPLVNNYTASGHVQVIRVPRYSAFTVFEGASVTTQPWDGSTGGVLAVEVKKYTVINGTVDVSGRGFRGGNSNELTGENIGISQAGNVNDKSGNRVFMGNGGNACDSANSTSGNGGGIIYLITGGPISGRGTIKSDGTEALIRTDSITSKALSCGNGGGGGSISIFTQGTRKGSITLLADGGKGGTTGFIGLKPLNPYSGNIVAPLALKNFSGEIKNNHIELSWIIPCESNTDYFTIERSADGYCYHRVGKTNAQGNNCVDNNYKFTDESPLAGANYYRLSKTDIEGLEEKFDPIQVAFDNKVQGLKIGYTGSNPFKDFINVDYYSEEPGIVEVQMINQSGQKVRSEQVVSNHGMNSFFFNDLASLNKGTYSVQLVTDLVKSQPVKIFKN